VFSTTVKHFAAILDALTEHTWGLTVSLKDFSDVSISASRPVAPGKKGGIRKELNHEYKET
jgi:hypothetical protein